MIIYRAIYLFSNCSTSELIHLSLSYKYFLFLLDREILLWECLCFLKLNLCIEMPKVVQYIMYILLQYIFIYVISILRLNNPHCFIYLGVTMIPKRLPSSRSNFEFVFAWIIYQFTSFVMQLYKHWHMHGICPWI